MHKKNKHKDGYNFPALINAAPHLAKYIIRNSYTHEDTIDFSDPKAIKALNSALLKSLYNINIWDIPEHYLCPAVPGRVDYIHHLNELLVSTSHAVLDAKSPITALDIGTGASCIYPLLGQSEYHWHFVASDIDPVSVKVARHIIEANPHIADTIDIRLQTNTHSIFNGIIEPNEFYHISLCNPPFHRSLSEANKGTSRKWRNLGKANKSKNDKSIGKNMLNFGGQKAELWCPGGELVFIHNMIKESKLFQHQVFWFTSLVSKKENLSKLKLYLKKSHVKQIKVINMAQGQKISRFIAWSYFDINKHI